MNIKKLFSNRNVLHILISALVILGDLLLVFLLSIISLKFDFSRITTIEFWVKYGITTFVTIIPFFVMYNYIKNTATKNDDIKVAKEKMQKNKDIVTENFLDKEFDEWIIKTNNIEKCREYIVFLDKSINKNKSNKKQLLEEKDKTLACLNLLREQVDSYAKLTDEKREEYIEATKDFNIGAVEFDQYTQISRGVVSLNFRQNHKHKIGEIDDKKQFFTDVIIKLTISTIITLLFYMVGFDKTLSGMQVFYDIVWRISMALINAYMGYLEGIEIQINSKIEAYKEVIDVQTKFLNYCQSFGILQLS